MFTDSRIEANVSAFKDQVCPNVTGDLTSMPSVLWVRIGEPVLRAVFYVFFIAMNVLNGALAAVFWWTRHFAVRPLATTILSLMLLVGVGSVVARLVPHETSEPKSTRMKVGATAGRPKSAAIAPVKLKDNVAGSEDPNR